MNDIQAHQSSVDTLNDAGRQLVETGILFKYIHIHVSHVQK